MFVVFSLLSKLYMGNIGLCNNAHPLSSCINESIESGRSYSEKSISIRDCLFTRLGVFSGNGGVIMVSIANFVLNIEKCVFNNNIATNGGSIFFNSYQTVFKMVCAYKNSADYSHFAQITVAKNNSIDYLSVSNCSQNLKGDYSLRMNNFHHFCRFINSSQNKAKLDSSLIVSVGYILLEFSSIYQNFADNIICYFSGTGSDLKSVNIIDNNCKTGSVIVAWSGPCKCHHCVFSNNYNCLFFNNLGSLSVFHSFIYHQNRDVKMTPFINLFNFWGHIGWGFGVKEVKK